MWGGTPDRNMISNMKGLPTDWDVKAKKNVKWVAQLGSQTYGNAVVSGGMVFVGTNNEGLRDPKITGDKGVLMAFRESDGQFMWQMVHDKLVAGRVNDWPYQGVASSPLVEGDRIYYVSNRAELMCLDTEGFRDKENDGPVDRREVDGRFQRRRRLALRHDRGSRFPAPQPCEFVARLLWRSRITSALQTARMKVTSTFRRRKSPAIIAVNKKTGKLVWEDNSVNDRILHGQWGSPTVGTIGGVVQVIHGQGDGWIRGYEALTGKKLWEFDTNPKDSVWPKTRNEVISTPVIYEDKVYIANGQDPEHGEGVGHMYCIDATKRGDITTRPAWFGTTTRFAARFPRRRSKTASFTKLTSADFCTRLTPRPVRFIGRTIFSPLFGDRRC